MVNDNEMKSEVVRHSKIKKEVSCKPLFAILNAAKNKGIDLNKILDGIPYELSYLLNRHERIEWWVFCKIITNLRPYFTYSDYEQMGKDFVKKTHYIEGYIFHFLFFSVSKIAKIAKGSLLKAGNAILKPLFSCFNPDLEIIGKNKFRISMYINPGYEMCPEWFYMSKGVMEELGSNVGLKNYRFNHISITSNVCSCEFSLKEEGIFAKLKKWLHWLFNIRKAFVDLTESHEELLNNYSKLGESKKLLQKQTRQLATAYNITKSIRQSYDINKTLNTITGALVNDAGLCSARIKIFKDIEGNKFEAEAFNGINEMNVSTIKHPIVINDEEVGGLIICPKIDTDISELDELLNYLIPIISISIHDSLVLRTITDYRNNLEMKVNERTAELKKARDQLSETNYLLQEMQKAQSRFYGNISHEFRTPLTLILGPAKQIIERTKDEKTRDELKIIHKNADRLLGLVNQLLDISKLESGNMKLVTIPQNIIPLLKDLVLSFCSYAERKRITLNFSTVEDEIIVYIDKDKIEKIITNILSNAFKFTPEGGEVEVSVNPKPPFNFPFAKGGKEGGSVEISIRDTGIGIPDEKIPKIFDRFYQVDGSHTREQKGTGIGLSLTKELVELHKGNIEVESEEGKGTTFTISIPLGKEHLKPEEISEAEKVEEKVSSIPEEMIYHEERKVEKPDIGLITETDLSADKAGKPVLLIVEDNADVRHYIKGNLNRDYRILEAVDGEDGWNKSVEHIPDLIVSDVMMPKMDGFELCDKLKTDERTSHIPVILLTAKASSQDKIEGFETGADDYIMKPFEPEELKARIRNLIEQRKRIHEHFRKHGLFEIEEEHITPVDQKFLQKAAAIINEHISDASFGVEMLANDMAVSRSLLLKKIEALIGEPPNELIKRTRLNKAAKLIESKFGNISEIALEVGFNNPSYFAECFKKQFGFSPSQYHRNSPNR